VSASTSPFFFCANTKSTVVRTGVILLQPVAVSSPIGGRKFQKSNGWANRHPRLCWRLLVQANFYPPLLSDMLGYYTNHGGSKAAWQRRTLCLLHGMAGKVAVADADELSGRRRGHPPALENLQCCEYACAYGEFWPLFFRPWAMGSLFPPTLYLTSIAKRKEASTYWVYTTKITTAN
jgi:hypothetical protein